MAAISSTKAIGFRVHQESKTPVDEVLNILLTSQKSGLDSKMEEYVVTMIQSIEAKDPAELKAIKDAVLKIDVYKNNKALQSVLKLEVSSPARSLVDSSTIIEHKSYEELMTRTNPEQLPFYANLFETGTNGYERDEKKAFSLYLRAAEAGDPTSMGKLTTMYEGGIGVEKNEKEMNRWMEKMSETLDKQESEMRLRKLMSSNNGLGTSGVSNMSNASRFLNRIGSKFSDDEGDETYLLEKLKCEAKIRELSRIVKETISGPLDLLFTLHNRSNSEKVVKMIANVNNLFDLHMLVNWGYTSAKNMYDKCRSMAIPSKELEQNLLYISEKEKMLNDELKKSPLHVLFYQIGQLCEEAGDQKKARQLYTESIKNCSNNEAILALAKLDIAMSMPFKGKNADDSKAMLAFNSIVKLASTGMMDAIFLLSKIYMGTIYAGLIDKNEELAKRWIIKAIAQDDRSYEEMYKIIDINKCDVNLHNSKVWHMIDLLRDIASSICVTTKQVEYINGFIMELCTLIGRKETTLL